MRFADQNVNNGLLTCVSSVCGCVEFCKIPQNLQLTVFTCGRHSDEIDVTSSSFSSSFSSSPTQGTARQNQCVLCID
jgi:hypothetical protein